MSNETHCIGCRRPQATLSCDHCGEPLCKSCAHFLAEDTFSFMTKVPAELQHTRYCPSCQGSVVEPALEDYREKIALAENCYFFFLTQRRALPELKRSKDKVKVENCVDRNETKIRLAFKAVEQGFNAIVEAEIASQKVRNEGWQKSLWTGTGVPALLDAEKLERER